MARPRDYNSGENVPGTVYRVVRLIGAGGMGTVYDVEDTTVGKRYVLKTLHPELHKRGDLAQRMVKEARTLARISHPNIVEVVTAGVTTDELKLPFYVMEKLNGQNLHTILSKKGSLELAHAIHITIDLLDALDNAHEKGVVHRDVKPDNIFLHISTNGQTTTKLLDFGIMRILDEPGVTAGRFMGTLRYAAPEQLRGETPMPQTDLYAVGLVLYEMIAGRGPFDDEGDSKKIAAAHLTSTPPPLLQWGAVVPEALERLVRGALSKDPHKRPKDAFTFASQLRNMNVALAAERRAGSATSWPTAVPVLGADSLVPSSALGARSPTPDVASASVVGLAATEHAATRAGTPDAKSPHSPLDPALGGTAVATSGPTVMGMSPPPPPGPTLVETRRGESSGFAPSSEGAMTVRTIDLATERAPGPVDRNAPTHSASGPLFASPLGPPPAGRAGPADPRLAPNDGSTVPVPVAAGLRPAAEWRAPSTLRMSSAPPRVIKDDGGASALLAGLAPREGAVAATDGAASSTVTPRTATRMRPVVAVAMGLALTVATVATLSLVIWGIRSRFSTREPPPVIASEAPAAPGPGSAFPAAAPTIPPPLDLPAPVASVPVAPAAASPPAPSAPPAATAPEPGAASRAAPTAEPAQPARPKPVPTPPASPPARRKLPGSGL